MFCCSQILLAWKVICFKWYRLGAVTRKHSGDRLLVFQSSLWCLGAPPCDFSLQIAWVSPHNILRVLDSSMAETMAAYSGSAWAWKTQNIYFWVVLCISKNSPQSQLYSRMVLVYISMSKVTWVRWGELVTDISGHCLAHSSSVVVAIYMSSLSSNILTSTLTYPGLFLPTSLTGIPTHSTIHSNPWSKSEQDLGRWVRPHHSSVPVKAILHCIDNNV